jgi:hypothetical protein
MRVTFWPGYHLENVGIARRIILKRILRKQNGKLWAEFS